MCLSNVGDFFFQIFHRVKFWNKKKKTKREQKENKKELKGNKKEQKRKKNEKRKKINELKTEENLITPVKLQFINKLDTNSQII